MRVECNELSENENGRVRAASPVPPQNREVAPSLFIRIQIFTRRIRARLQRTRATSEDFPTRRCIEWALYAVFRGAEVVELLMS